MSEFNNLSWQVEFLNKTLSFGNENEMYLTHKKALDIQGLWIFYKIGIYCNPLSIKIVLTCGSPPLNSL